MAKRAYSQALATLSAIPIEASAHSPSIPPALLIRVLRNKTIAHLGLTLVTSPPEPELAAANEDNIAAQALAARSPDPSLASRVRLDTAALRARGARISEKSRVNNNNNSNNAHATSLHEIALAHYEAIDAALKDWCHSPTDWDTRAQALLGCEHVARRLNGRRQTQTQTQIHAHTVEGWVKEALFCVQEAMKLAESSTTTSSREDAGADSDSDAEPGTKKKKMVMMVMMDEGLDLDATAEAVRRAIERIKGEGRKVTEIPDLRTENTKRSGLVRH